MNSHIKRLTADKVISRMLWVAGLFFVVSIVYLSISYKRLPPFVPLFNQSAWGDGRLAPRLFLFLPSGITLIATIINIEVSSFLYERTPLLARMLMITTFLLTILLFVYYFRTLHLIM
jgi:hypothetical protein